MNLQVAKRELCTYGRRAYARQLLSANEGNLSVRLSRGEILCTRSLVCKGFMQPADICRVDMAGRQLAGRRRVSSEVSLHLAIYAGRPDINAIIHCHPPHVLAFAITGQPIPMGILPEAELFLGDVPIVPYVVPGSAELASTVRSHIGSANIVILANHGAVACGANLESAWLRAELLEACCRVVFLARQLGPMQKLSAHQLAELGDLRAVWDKRMKGGKTPNPKSQIPNPNPKQS
jgi:L-fuculose-phosphate aldolase